MSGFGIDSAANIVSELETSIARSKHPIPVGISNRHFHITEEHWRILFGEQDPTEYRRILQPGFWAAKETVDVEGPKGRINRIRLVAPFRSKTQVEISRTDASALGIKPPVRGSGKLEGAAPLRLHGPKGHVDVEDAAIIAQRHVHFSPADADKFGIKGGEMLRVRAGIGGPREMVFEKCLARVSDKFALEFHVDLDECNAAWLKHGDFVHIV